MERVVEWSITAVLKTAVPPRHPGFESLSLRSAMQVFLVLLFLFCFPTRKFHAVALRVQRHRLIVAVAGGPCVACYGVSSLLAVRLSWSTSFFPPHIKAEMRHPYVFTAFVMVCCQVGAVHQFYSASVLAKSQKVGLNPFSLLAYFVLYCSRSVGCNRYALFPDCCTRLPHGLFSYSFCFVPIFFLISQIYILKQFVTIKSSRIFLFRFFIFFSGFWRVIRLGTR